MRERRAIGLGGLLYNKRRLSFPSVQSGAKCQTRDFCRIHPDASFTPCGAGTCANDPTSPTGYKWYEWVMPFCEIGASAWFCIARAPISPPHRGPFSTCAAGAYGDNCQFKNVPRTDALTEIQVWLPRCTCSRARPRQSMFVFVPLPGAVFWS
jgi:hypothetical protein